MSDKKIALVIFCLLLFCYGYSHGGTGANPDARLDLLHAIANQGTLAIDAYHGNTPDKSYFDGHYYSDKAPGIALLALPAFLLSKIILSSVGINVDSPIGWYISSWITTFGSVGLIAALGGCLSYLWLIQFVSKHTALVTVLAVFLGSLVYPYATFLFSHAGTIGLLSIGLWGVFSKKNTYFCSLVSGLSCGLAVVGEYTAALVVIVITLLQLRRGFLLSLSFFIFLFFALLIVPAYNWICFDSPFSIGYSHVYGWSGMHEGFFGIGTPKTSVIIKLLFSRGRGLFFWSPILLMSLGGIYGMYKNHKILLLAAIAISLMQVTMISGYYVWDGGHAVGPRHLASLIPLFILPVAYGVSRFPKIGIFLAGVSIFLVGFTTLIYPANPNSSDPLMEYYLVRMIRGDITDNLGTFFGLKGIWSFLPVFLIVYEVVGLLVAKIRTNCEPNINCAKL